MLMSDYDPRDMIDEDVLVGIGYLKMQADREDEIDGTLHSQADADELAASINECELCGYRLDEHGTDPGDSFDHAFTNARRAAMGRRLPATYLVVERVDPWRASDGRGVEITFAKVGTGERHLVQLDRDMALNLRQWIADALDESFESDLTFECGLCGRIGNADDGIDPEARECPDEECGGLVYRIEWP